MKVTNLVKISSLHYYIPFGIKIAYWGKIKMNIMHFSSGLIYNFFNKGNDQATFRLGFSSKVVSTSSSFDTN